MHQVTHKLCQMTEMSNNIKVTTQSYL